MIGTRARWSQSASGIAHSRWVHSGSLELDLPLVQDAPAKAEVQEDQAHKEIAEEAQQELQDGTPGVKEEMTIWEDMCLKRKRRKNSQGKDPRTDEGNSQGRDTSTQERNSQGEDPRTLDESSKCGNVSSRQIHSQGETRERLKHQFKRWRGEKKRKEKKWKRKKKKRKSEAQKKPLVSTAQRTSLEFLCLKCD